MAIDNQSFLCEIKTILVNQFFDGNKVEDDITLHFQGQTYDANDDGYALFDIDIVNESYVYAYLTAHHALLYEHIVKLEEKQLGKRKLDDKITVKVTFIRDGYSIGEKNCCLFQR
uniref:Uncharacterized protein n=1 Tax=Ditylenchus dipsaci TaxID=166011 RepID=A0A915EPL1_9BILA